MLFTQRKMIINSQYLGRWQKSYIDAICSLAFHWKYFCNNIMHFCSSIVLKNKFKNEKRGMLKTVIRKVNYFHKTAVIFYLRYYSIFFQNTMQDHQRMKK